MPQIRSYAPVSVINGKAYLFGGLGSSRYNDLRVLDLSTNVWTLETPLVGTAPTIRSEHTSAVINGRMYIFGGFNGSTTLADMHSYDPYTRTWLNYGNIPEGSSTVMSAMQLGSRAQHTAVVADGTMWIFGGYVGSMANLLGGFITFKPYIGSPTVINSGTAPTSVAYSSPWVFTRGMDIPSKAPTVTGSRPTTYSAASLPAGLSIAPDSGVIYGTPTTVSASTTYTITASNELGSLSTTVTISVIAPSWSDLTTTLCATVPSARYASTMVAIDGVLYLFAGNSADGHRNELFAYDINTACWTNLSTATTGTTPGIRYYHTAAVMDGKMYIFGGHNGSSYLNDLHRFDPVTRTWTNLSSTSTGSAPGGRLGASMVAANGKLYIFGGDVGGTYRNDLYTWTPNGASGTWATLTATGTIANGAHRVAAFINDKIYVFGGQGSVYLNDLHSLDLTTNTWTSLNATTAGTPPPVRADASGVVINGELYIFGGRSPSSLSDFYVFDPLVPEWVNLANLPEGAPTVLSYAPMSARDTHAAAVSDGVMYVFGGRNSGNRLSTLLAYLPFW